MQIAPLLSSAVQNFNSPNLSPAAEGKPSFASFLDAYQNIFEGANDAVLEAGRIQTDFAAGRTDDMVSLMIAQEKAYAALNLTVQVTNKILEAYQAVMRMQI